MTAAKVKAGQYYRLGIKGSEGCAGYKYHFSVTPFKTDQDQVLQFPQCTILVEAKSWAYLENCAVDLEKTMMQEKLVIQNPGAKSVCGCGESFEMVEK